VDGVDIAIAPNATQDEIGLAIVNALGALQAAHPDKYEAAGYNTLTKTVTFQFTLLAGDVAPIVVVSSPGNFGNFTGDVNTDIPGVDGTLGGMLSLDNMQSGGTLELQGPNSGLIDVNLVTNTAADDFNILLTAANNHFGNVDVTGIETLNVVNSGSNGQLDLGLIAPDTTTVVATGLGTVDFFNEFDSLTSFDGSGGGLGIGDDGYWVWTNAATAATLIGSQDDDVLIGTDVLGQSDAIIGGAGDDEIAGRKGGDILTGGAGDDVFVYRSVQESFGAHIDTITDFTSGDDALDFSFITFWTGIEYLGEVTSLAAANTALEEFGGFGVPPIGAVFDTSESQLYVDVNDNGVIDGGDMIIALTGVTTLDQNDFIG
jgi:Ca2+-binding RTX toxin-like protein